MNARRAIWLAAVLLVVAAGGAYGVWKSGLLRTPSSGRSPFSPAAQNFPPYFEEIASSSGVDFEQWCGDSGRFFFPEVMGSGVALFDYNRDGRLDIFVVQAMPRKGAPDREPLGGRKPSPTSRLYRQEPDGRFVDVTQEAGLIDHEPYGVGVAVGDVNNDGWPDLYISKFGHDRLYLNRQGKFEDVTTAAGIANARWGTSACFFDYDRDGWLDLFVTNYVDYFPSQHCMQPNGSQDFCHPIGFQDAPSRLFRNVTGEVSDSSSAAAGSGQVRFRDVGLESGIDAKRGPGLGVLPGDFNGDGWLDVYVANDSKANFLWINQGDGVFREEAISSGAACDIAGRPQSSMGVARGDVNGDGRDDLFMTHFGTEYHTLYLQTDAGVFEDRTVELGLATVTLQFTGFGAAFVDLDLDGDLDLPVANGRVTRRGTDRDVDPAKLSLWSYYAERNQLFLGNGDGTFVEAAPGDEPFLSGTRVARGLAVGDLDNDGDMDVVTTEVNGPVRIYRNVAPRQGNWLLVKAIDPRRGGRDAYSAVVTVSAGGRRWSRDINPAYSYLSSNDPRAHFGLGNAVSVERIEVLWPDGAREIFPGGEVNRQIELKQGEGKSP